MAGISLVLGEGFVLLPIEQTMIWAAFYATLFWLPVRGVAAVFQRRSAYAGGYRLRHRERRASSRPAYHVGMKILPPF